MRISQINYSNFKKTSPNFKSNLWVEKSAETVINCNKDEFTKAAEEYNEWLKTDKGYYRDTMIIRENTSLMPNIITRHETEFRYDYPYEEAGYNFLETRHYRENLEFQLGNKKCGFWFNPKSTASELLNDFKNMFNYMEN